MIDPAILVPYVLACLLFSLVPGPSVSIVVANALGGGTRAGFLTILGTELSMFSMVVVVALGAVASGRARHVLSAARVRLVNRISGAALICGGIWLALQRRA